MIAWFVFFATTSLGASATGAGLCAATEINFYDLLAHPTGGNITVAGSSVEPILTTAPATCGGETVARAIHEYPWVDLSWVSLTYETITLPNVGPGELLQLETRVGIDDTAVVPQSVRMVMDVGVPAVLSAEVSAVTAAGWRPLSLDITSLAGTTVDIRFHVGSNGESDWDFAVWEEPRIVVSKKRLSYGYPENGHQAIGPYGVNTLSGNLGFTVTDLAIPFNGTSLVFARTYNSQRAGTVSVFGDSGQVSGPALSSVMGPGWSHNWELNLTPLVESASGATYYVEQRIGGRTAAYTMTLSGVLLNPAGVHDAFSVTLTGMATNPGQMGAGVILRNKHGPRKIYDPLGKLKRLEEPNGTSLDLSWNATTQRLDAVTATSATSQDSVSIGFEYNAAGRLVKLTAPHPSGTGTIVTQFLYGGTNGTLMQVLGPGGIYGASYLYDGANRMTQRLDARLAPGQKRLRFSYDSAGRIRDIKRSSDVQIGRYAYLSALDGSLRTVYEQDGRVTEWSYSDCRILAGVRVGSLVGSTMRWDPDLNPTVYVDPNGRLETSAYDSQGNLVASKNPLGGIRSTSYEPVFNRAITTTDERGDQSNYSYDSTGNMLESVRQVAAIPALGESTTEFAVRRSYNSRGLLVQSEDADGHEVLNGYDGRGNLTRVTRKLSTGAGAIDLTTIFEYDALGRSTAQIDPRGVRSEWVYDLENRIIQVRQGIVDGNPPMATTTNSYDNVTNLLTKAVDATGRFTQYAYTTLDQLSLVSDAAGARFGQVHSASGDLLVSRDGNGHETRYTYDLSGRMTHVEQDLATGSMATVKVEYDPAGNMTAITDPNGNTTAHEYDALNRKIKTVHQDATEERWEYDQVGNMTAFVDAMGTRTEMLNDSAGRLRRKHFTDGSTPDVTMFYSPGGETLEIHTQVNTKAGPENYITKNEFDSLHRQTKTEIVGLATKRMSYDENDNLVRLDVDVPTTSGPNPDLVIEKVFDPLNRATHILHAGLTTAFEYEPGCATCGSSGSRLAKIIRPNGISTTMMYDSRGRLISLRNEVAKTRAALSFCTYTHDAADNRTSMQDVSGLWTYSYDFANRLMEADHPLWADQHFTYDPAGNRTQLNDEFSGKTDSTFTETNALATAVQTSGTAAGSSRAYTFNARGELAKVETTLPDLSVISATYLFDSAGRMVGGQHKTFGYDSSGQRVYETDGKSETWYVNDGITLLMELDGSKTPSVVYNPGISQTRLDQQPPLTEYMLHDGLGSVVQWTDQQGNLTQELFYEPYGRQQHGPRPDSKHRHRYIGQAHDDALDLTCLNARWMDAGAGVFLSRDELDGLKERPLSLNRMSYVSGNPIMRSDPTGLTDCTDYSTELAEDFRVKGAGLQAEDSLGFYWFRNAYAERWRRTVSGFKPSLVHSGQGPDVYKHIYASAGLTLMGPIGEASSWVYQKLVDEYQAYQKASAFAEVAGDKAGREVGRATLGSILKARKRIADLPLFVRRTEGRITASEASDLRQKIVGILCREE